MTEPVIREATLDDVDRIVELTREVAGEGRWIGTEVPFDEEVRRARIAGAVEAPDATVLVVDAGTVVGEIHVVIAPYGVADVAMLLADGWRGQGLGTALLEAGLSWATEQGAHKAWLEVWPHNEAGLALYRRLGFVEEGRKRRHYRRRNGELWDAVLMGRRLDDDGPRDAVGP